MAQLFFSSQPKRSPIDAVTHSTLFERFSFIYSNDSQSFKKGESQFNLRLSPTSLAVLYCYMERASQLPENERNMIDPLTRISPQHFINLAAMVMYVCESYDGVSGSYDLDALRNCHAQALIEKEEISSTFDSLSLSSAWSKYGG